MQLLNLSINDSWHPKYLHYLAGAIVAFYVTTAVLAVKQSTIFGLTFSIGTFSFPFVLILGDIVSEVYGYKRSRQIIFIGFFAMVYYTLLTTFAIYLPPAETWGMQKEYETVLGMLPRIVVASLITYICCDLINSYIIARMKVWQGSNGFTSRAVVSTAVAQGVDSIMFFTLAFWGILSGKVILSLIVTTWVMKIILEIVCLPITTRLVKKFKQWEGTEHFDRKPEGEVVLKIEN